METAGQRSSVSVMKQALEALEKVTKHFTRTPSTLMDSEARVEAHSAITALRQALEQPADEPVAWQGIHDTTDLYWRKPVQGDVRPLYTHPQPAAQWVGLTEDEINKLRHLVDWTAEWSHGRFAYEIEQTLKEKNT
jgi:hypothetical protein